MISCSQSLLVSLVAPAAAQAAGGYQCCRKRREGDLGTKGPQRGAPAWVVPGELGRWNGWKWMEMVNGWVGELFCRLKGLYSTYIYKYMYRERETYRDIKRYRETYRHTYTYYIYIHIYYFQIQKQNGTLEPLLLLGCKSKHEHVCCRCLGFMKIWMHWRMEEWWMWFPIIQWFVKIQTFIESLWWFWCNGFCRSLMTWPGGWPLPAEVPQIVNDGVTIARAITLQVQFSEGFWRVPQVPHPIPGAKETTSLEVNPKRRWWEKHWECAFLWVNKK